MIKIYWFLLNQFGDLQLFILSLFILLYSEQMAYQGFSDFQNQLLVLSNLQILLVDVIDSEYIVSETKKQGLFSKFTEIEIESNFLIYESFLQLLSRVSLLRPSNQKCIEIIKEILKELNLNHDLKSSFCETTIFCIFKKNKNLVLFLYEEGIIGFDIIKNEIIHSQKRDYMSFFLPEMQKYDPQLNRRYIHMFQLQGEMFNNEDDLNKFILSRSKGHSPEKIASIIRDDDLDAFISYETQRDNFKINEQINDNLIESNEDINNFSNGVSLIEYSMIFGSLNIFKYLWVKKAKIKSTSPKYSIIGRNYEIIQILEEESSMNFDINCLSKSIEYLYQDITDYLLGNHNFELTESLLYKISIPSIDFVNLYKILKDPSPTLENSNNEYFSGDLLKHDYNKEVFTEYISKNPMEYYIYVNFVVQQQFIDINAKCELVFFIIYSF
ncbi:hypothetical protein TRFO_03666 [Tritrichomonas foetus]|uniref:DUF3447 domain-containing protein n=1 Tax=Tritrichomonas foetus TaxID=1144522 RepID=A0A1J4KS30_9EUKA|nr:hypothetical protein TRFO_03666 [Tritrichomonas foetus]|eukprot:OHT12628.1 hypothetical protein TRFO_03666 [Tritrichomonas foetus]